MKKKSKIWTIIYILFFLAGASLLLYPTLSNYYNSFHSSKSISQYVQDVSDLDDSEKEEMLIAAKTYNKSLLGKNSRWKMTDKQREVYNSLLDISSTNSGVMGYIEIPKLDVSIPIYHGTNSEVLQVAVGHMEGSSLPVGGTGTHAVLSGHRGLPSAKLFTDLDKMEIGDTFKIRVLDEVLAYEVDQILVVLPGEMDALQIEDDKDLCTLVTCTPYGVNSHRLLVRGHRIENTEKKLLTITSEALQIDPKIVMPFIALPILLIYIIILVVKSKRK